MIIKRILSLLLSLCLLIGSVPLAARAENTPETTVDTGDIRVEGTNGFGTLLSDEIASYQSEVAHDGNPGGYTVTGLEIVGNQATVTYDSLDEAQLVVALYTEDGVQLLTSAKTIVNPDETEAVVEFEGEMPQYFMASAYLLDSYDHSPLCDAYDTPMYTRDMQELLASTVDDYDPDRVLNLDSDKTTNFAVYGEDTIVIDYVPGVNTVSAIDDESRTYVITNADDQIKALRPGDVLAYPFAVNDILVIKVGDVQVDGSTVTINGTDLEMEEVFAYVKMDGTNDTEDMVITDLDPNDGITYLGSDSGLEPRPMAAEGDGETSISRLFGIDTEHEGTLPGGIAGGKVTIKGGLQFTLKIQYCYYVSLERQYLEFKVVSEITSLLEVGGEVTVKFASFAKCKVGPIYGLIFECEPSLDLKVSGKASVSATISGTFGFAFDSDHGFKNLCTSPTVVSDVSVEGEAFIGLDMHPKVVMLTEYLAAAELSWPVGLTISAKLTGEGFEGNVLLGSDEEPSSIHSCEECLDIAISIEASMEVTLQFLKNEKLKYHDGFKIGYISWPFYKSFTYDTKGRGSCPYRSYRVTVEVRDADGKRVPNAAVKAYSLEHGTQKIMGVTGPNGSVVQYLRAGRYTFSAEADEKEARSGFDVTDACKVVLTLGDDDDSNLPEDPDAFLDGEISAEGRCGNNLTWKLYSNGLLKITGTGPMYDFESYDTVPWRYAGIITKVVIDEGATSIGSYAFYERNVASVSLPESLTSIGSYAFHHCYNLTELDIPDNVTTIGSWTFAECYKLTYITLPANLKSIGSYTFDSCNRLACITIPDGVKHIGNGAFRGCSNMGEVILGNGLTTIGEYAFAHCSSLRAVTLPSGVTDIGKYAFYQCSGLSAINIPNGVQSIGDATFLNCKSLTNVTLGSGLKTIGVRAFNGCTSLASITLPEGLTSIGEMSFGGCVKLTGINIPSTLSLIGEDAFAACLNFCGFRVAAGNPYYSNDIAGVLFNKNQTVLIQTPCALAGTYTIPASVNTIGSYGMAYCMDLVGVVIGLGVTSIETGAFYNCVGLEDVYYRGTQAQWDSISIGSDNEALDYADIHYNSSRGAAVILDPTPSSDFVIPGDSADGRNPDAVFGGEYGSETVDGNTLKIATFTGLVPGGQYVLLALVEIDTSDVLAPENVLYIDQAAAGEDGTLIFRYAQRVSTDVSYVIACGPSNKNLADAEITFPQMTADGTLQVVNPTVTYEGKILTEGKDYVITGIVDFTQAGSYTCFIRGIHDYTGLVACQYTVMKQSEDPTDPTDPEQPVIEDVTRLAGANRWETSLKVADEMKANLGLEKFESIIIASGNDFADALAGSYLSTVKNAPILLGWGKGGKYVTLDEANIAYIKANLAEGGTVYILGGKNAVPELYENELKGFKVVRLGGANRFETNLLILEEAGVAEGSEVLVCTSTNFADSLSASATAKPILLVFNEYGKLYGKQPEFLAGLKNCTFTVIGGESAVSADLAKAIEAYGKVERLAGANRFETSVLVAQKYFASPETAVLAYAWNYPDGLCGGSLAFSLKAPLILTMTKYEAKAVEYMTKAGIEIGLVLGGETLISDDAVRSIFAMDAADGIVEK